MKIIKTKQLQKGFTLIEVLLVIVLIGILISIGLVTFNVEARFIDTRNDTRKTHIQTLESAITQYKLQEGDYPTGLSRNYQEICDPEATDCIGFFDLKQFLVPNYLQAIPQDPNDTDTTGGAGYSVAVDEATNTVSVRSLQAEAGVEIKINDPLPVEPTTISNTPLAATVPVNPPPPPPWTPTQISTALWLDADDASTITLNGSTVSQWRDKSGNGRHVDQVILNNQPSYQAIGFNSKPTVSFDGTNDSLKNASYQPVGAVSVFIVFRRSQSKGALINIQRSGGVFEVVGKPDSSYRSITITAAGNINPAFGFDISGDGVDQNIILGVQHNGATNTSSNFTGHVNGTSQTITTSGAVGYLSETGFSIGGRPVQNLLVTYFSGQISEIVFLNSTLSTDDRQRLEGYLAWKWGLVANLPADHPYKNSAPTI